MIISSIFDLPVILTSIVSSIIIISWFAYWNKTNLARTEKEKAFVCTLLSSFITSLSSIPLVIELISNGGNIAEILVYRTWTVLATTFFITFLFLDLCIGMIYYRNKIDLLTGWIHHTAYIFLLCWSIFAQATSTFIMMCILEVPTFLLALGSIRTQFRHDYLFAITFLLTRILFHMYAISCAWNMEPFGRIVNAMIVFFPVHCYWFYGFIKQQLRLKNQKKSTNKNNQPIINDVTMVNEKVIQKKQTKLNQRKINYSTKSNYNNNNITSLYSSPSPSPVSVH